jgi:hypothetical protein
MSSRYPKLRREASFLRRTQRRLREMEEREMGRIKLDAPAPDFTLENFRGETVRLSDYRDRSHVLLVFNRGFT